MNMNDEIIKSVIDFVNKNKEKLNSVYSNASRSLRKTYIKPITIDEYNRNLIKVSVVILTANEYEENVLNYYAFKNQPEPNGHPVLEVEEKIKFKNEKIRFNAYLLKINSQYVLHLHAKNTGSYTTGGSADLVRYVAENELLHPKCIISFGICFGHSCDVQNLGDTIIAKNLYPYFIGVKLTDGTLTVKSDEFVLHLENSYPDLYDGLECIRRNGELDCEWGNNIESETKIGNLITGEAVISDAILKKVFEDATKTINPLGGEMEGFGLGKECSFYNIPCMLIKSICDWGAGKNIDNEVERATSVINSKNKIQAYASYCAYTVLQKLFDNQLFGASLYDELADIFVNMYNAGAGIFIPHSEVKIQLLSFNKKIHKKITDKYIEEFCHSRILDGAWKEINESGRGYLIVSIGGKND